MEDQSLDSIRLDEAARTARTLDRLASAASGAVADDERRAEIGLPEIEAQCRDYALAWSEMEPLEAPITGFDKPANIYVVSEIYQAGGHRAYLEQMIAARPQERHIVVFTGAITRNLEYSIGRVREIGAFPLWPDVQSTLRDRYIWLRRKLAALAAKRVFLFHHPEDVLATCAGYEIAPRLGRRLFVVRHTDTRPSLGAELFDATHVVIRKAQGELIRKVYPQTYCVHLPLSNPFEKADRSLWDSGFFFNGVFTTATVGGGHKFDVKGDLAFGKIIAGVVRATRGRHLHFGAVDEAFRQSVLDALDEAKIPAERVIFIGEVNGVGDALKGHKVDLFIASFPIGGGLTVTEAASAGRPIVVYDPGGDDATARYVAGAGHSPEKSLVWSEPEELWQFLKEVDEERLAKMARSSADWYDAKLSPAKFRQRLKGIHALVDGRAPETMEAIQDRVRRVFFDVDYYRATYPDVAETGIDLFEHYRLYGDAEGRMPCALFDPKHYLAQLEPGERALAEVSPLAHYAVRGERRGLSPHPLFDPVLSGMQPVERPEGSGILEAYVMTASTMRTHSFFDGAHYVKQRSDVGGEPVGTPLDDFLRSGADDRLSPHPLVDMNRFAADPLDRFIGYVSKARPAVEEMSPCALFDPRHFCGGDVFNWVGAAPNLLWAHMIEGTKRYSDPHPFISIDHIARSHGNALVEMHSILEVIGSGGFKSDTHPLIRANHISEQAPWIEASGMSATQYFSEFGIAHNIDPHPYFSMQYYLHRNPDVAATGQNPLLHYLTAGQFEGRLPHPFFDGNHYFHSWLKNRAERQHGPLMDYVMSGAGAFHSVQPMDATAVTVNRKMADRLFHLEDDKGACSFLMDATHPHDAPSHPTLECEVRDVLTDTPCDGDFAIGTSARVVVRRPAVVHAKHIAPKSGEYHAEAPCAFHCRGATVVAGNDGLILDSGEWFDPGLKSFDPAVMEIKENGAVVSIDDACARVLLRRHRHTTVLESGIHASGTYSHNYFHFMMEVLPRVMIAHRIAPPEVPILADDHMPMQHFQMLRGFFPDRAIRRLNRGFSYQVGELFFANAPQVVHDVLDADEAPVDAVRYHPDILKALSEIGLDYRIEDVPRQKLYFSRRSGVRKMQNAEEVESAMRARGFTIVHCDDLSFSEQVRLSANAEVIVAQSGAHLANIVFARPDTRVYALYSNAPGTNYYLWDAIGQQLGLRVTNIAGWRIFGSAPKGIAEIHEDFVIPLGQLTPFFMDDEEVPDDLWQCLDALYAANAQADTITAAWTVIGDRTPDGFEDHLKALRAAAGALIPKVSDSAALNLLNHPFFADFGRNIRSGLAALADYSDAEQDLIETVGTAFEKWCLAEEGWQDVLSQDGSSEDDEEDDAQAEDPDDETRAEAAQNRLLALAQLYLPVHGAALRSEIDDLPENVLRQYVNWLVTPPFLFREGDDTAYGDFAARLLGWFDDRLGEDIEARTKSMLIKVVKDIDLGTLLLIDRPVRDVADARNRLLDRLAVRGAASRAAPRPADGSQGKRRVGVLCRTFEKGPDSEAVVAFFKSFDKSDYEIFAYSVGFRDRVVSADAEFAEEFDAVIDHRRTLTGNPRDMRDSLIEDDLDVFLHANATTYGVRAQELALYHRVAPIQMVLNSHVPMSFGFPTYDGYVTGRSDDPAHEIDQANFVEPLIRCDGPVICYLNSLKPRPEPLFDRASLGLSDDDVVLMNAGSLSKLRHACLKTMFRALAEVPKAKLLLAPYNPGWVARSQAFAFNRQLAEMAEETGVDLDRVVVMGELSVAEAESALALCDIYLNPFPHGGATMTHLALINGKPPVTLRRRSSRSIDQFLVQSVGAEDLLASDEDAYVATVRRLAENRDLCKSTAQRIREAAKNPPFVNNAEYSDAMCEVIAEALARFGKRQDRTK